MRFWTNCVSVPGCQNRQGNPPPGGSGPERSAGRRRAAPPSSAAPPPPWTAASQTTCGNHTVFIPTSRPAEIQQPATQRDASPALKHAQRVKLAGAAKGDDQQQAADQAADDGGGDDSGGDDDGAALLVAAVAAVVLSVAHPRLEHAAVVLGKKKKTQLVLQN